MENLKETSDNVFVIAASMLVCKFSPPVRAAVTVIVATGRAGNFSNGQLKFWPQPLHATTSLVKASEALFP
jgi:hypothetical protein